MNTTETATVARSARSVPPPPEPSSPPRFRGPAAELASLQVQLERAREAGDEEAEARLSEVLARALASRGIETREMLRLAERAYTLASAGPLASELSAWWAGVGEPARAATILQRLESRTSSGDRGPLWMRIGVLLARAGKGGEAAQAFEAALRAAPSDPLPAELLGTLRGWDAISSERASAAFHEAALRRRAHGDDAGAFENWIRAFEASPGQPVAAEALANALEERSRFEAAEEVLREHARSGSAAHRAAIHQRCFVRRLASGDLYAALGSALDAELDAAFDAERLGEVLRVDADDEVRDIEALFVSLARRERAIGQWLLATVDVGVSAWGVGAVQSLRAQVQTCLLPDERLHQLTPEIALGEEEIERRSAVLREQLLRPDASESHVRLELARLLSARGDFSAAQEVLVPLLVDGGGASLEAACLAAVVAVRAGRPETRARALLHIALHATGRIRAVIASVAAEELTELSLLEEGRRAAELSIEADSSWQRGVAAQALIAQRDPDGAAGALLERSLAVVLARSQACRVLADTSERRGATRLALTWTQRQLSQRPGQPTVAAELLRRAVAAGDGERLADALSWLLSQPIPISQLAAPVADALRALADLAADRVAELARRVLDVMGPRVTGVREAIIFVAELCDLPALKALVLERWLVTAPAEVRSEAYIAIAELRARAGDITAALFSLKRALAAGAPISALREPLDDIQEPEGSDAVLAYLELRAQLLTPESKAWLEAVRKWGASRWDLANDPRGAIEIWKRALTSNDAHAAEQLASDLRAFAGSQVAAGELSSVAATVSDNSLAGRIFGLAARAALEADLSGEAFRMAREALLRHPANADVLTIAERAAGGRELDELASLYSMLAEATLGRYGERAVHYRAARQLEKRGRQDVALRHAIAAFEAVPAEGVTFVLMARLADRAGAADEVVAVLERVASRVPDRGARALWLERAASLADTSEAGRRQRIDVLLRALAIRPDATTLATLVDALRQLLAEAPEEADVAELRFERALGVLLPKVNGMDGALFALLACRSALDLFGSDDLAMRALARAAECDSEVEQFVELGPHARRLAELGEPARAFVRWCTERASKPMMAMGRPLAELAAKIAESQRDEDARVRLLVRAASESPEDAELVRLVQELASSIDDPTLRLWVEQIIPVDDRARQVLERAAGVTVDEALDLLLDVELDRLSAEVRRDVLHMLAQRQEEIGRLDDAEASYRALLALDSAHVSALEGLERAAERRSDFEELTRLLLRRAEATTDAEQALAIRLRRVTVLEQQLGRIEEARQQLERLLSAHGERTEVLTRLADLYGRTGTPSRAAALWTRASTVCESAAEAAIFSLHAADAHLKAGELDAARRALEGVRIDPLPTALWELRVQLARQSGDRAGLVQALTQVAERGAGGADEAVLLVEAATAAEQLGELNRAVELAAQAARWAPRVAEAQLLARRLEYMLRGAGTAENAARTVAELRGLSDGLSHRQIELRAFLLAEALDVAEGGGAGFRELDRAVERVGSRALVAVGLAERLEDDPRRALQLLDASLGSDLHGLRGEGQVLIRAGRVARSLGELDRAQAYFSAVAHDDPRQVEAAAELREIAAERKREEREAQERASREAFERTSREASERAAREAAEQQRERAAKDERQEVEPALRENSENSSVMRAAPEVNARRASGERAPSAGSINLRRTSAARPPSVGAINVQHERLRAAFDEGDEGAGKRLLEFLIEDGTRSHERLMVAGRLANLRPGDEWTLRQLAQAAEAERNGPLASAVRHVLGTFGIVPLEVAPEVSRLREQPGEVRRILTGQLQSPGMEATAAIWESIPNLYKQEPSAYGVTGLERIAAGPLTPLSRLYQDASRLLGFARTPVFQRRGSEGIALSVALLMPPALLVTGEIDESSLELAFHFGAMLMATSPEFALLFGAEPAKVRTLLEALVAAFGPPSSGRPTREVTQLAGVLWESIPPRGQRRLTHLCAEPQLLAYERVTAVARQVLRRAGLLVCADLATAVVAACEEERLPPPRTLGELGECCRQSAVVSDLVRLALSPEYAELRWNASF